MVKISIFFKKEVSLFFLLNLLFFFFSLLFFSFSLCNFIFQPSQALMPSQTAADRQTSADDGEWDWGQVYSQPGTPILFFSFPFFSDLLFNPHRCRRPNIGR